MLTISFLALPAGDLGDTLGAVRLALQLLRPKFKRVVFVPGNHDLCVSLIKPVQWAAVQRAEQVAIRIAVV